jgi:hypothetical protein
MSFSFWIGPAHHQYKPQFPVRGGKNRIELQGFSEMRLRFRRSVITQKRAKIVVRLFILGVDANRAPIGFFRFEVLARVSQSNSK